MGQLKLLPLLFLRRVVDFLEYYSSTHTVSISFCFACLYILDMGFIYVCDKTSKSKVLITWVSKEDHGLQIGVHGLIVFLDAEKFENYFFAEVSQRITSINIRYFKDVRVPITSHTIFMHSVSSRKFSLQKLNSLSLFLTLNKICYSPVDILYVSVVCAVSPPSSVQSCNVCSLIFKSKRRQ